MNNLTYDILDGSSSQEAEENFANEFWNQGEPELSLLNKGFHSPKNDSIAINRGRSPSLVLAAGNSKGSTANTSIESLQSTIIGGALDSEASFDYPSEILRNLHLSADDLDKRFSREEEFLDCESSSKHETNVTSATSSTNEKSHSLLYSPNKHRAKKNNTIVEVIDISADSPTSDNSDAADFSGLPLRLQHYLTTILEESTDLSDTGLKSISGSKLIPLIENLRKDQMPNLPQTEKFQKNIRTVAQFLDKSSKEITTDQIAHVLLYSLPTDYSFASEYLSGTDTFLSFAESSELCDIDPNNTGRQMDIMRHQLRKSLENNSRPLQTIFCANNDFPRNNISMPSTSETQRKRSPNQKNNNSSHKQSRNPSTPAARAQGHMKQTRSASRSGITNSSTERSVINTPMEQNREKNFQSTSKKNNSPRKRSWRY